LQNDVMIVTSVFASRGPGIPEVFANSANFRKDIKTEFQL
jgi:hypothetical protein